jgi:hypothetical protein
LGWRVINQNTHTRFHCATGLIKYNQAQRIRAVFNLRCVKATQSAPLDQLEDGRLDHGECLRVGANAKFNLIVREIGGHG